MKSPAPPAGPRRRHLYGIDGGKAQEARVVRELYPYEKRRARSEPQPPTPPRAA